MKKERTQITQELCEHVRILLAGGANLNKAAEITGTGHATISRIKAAGFSAETYRKNQQQKKEQKKPELVRTINHEELAGQMEMDLQAAEEPKGDWRKDFIQSEQTRMMRFQAHQADKIMMMQQGVMNKLEKVNDTLNQILRAVRKE